MFGTTVINPSLNTIPSPNPHPPIPNRTKFLNHPLQLMLTDIFNSPIMHTIKPPTSLQIRSHWYPHPLSLPSPLNPHYLEAQPGVVHGV